MSPLTPELVAEVLALRATGLSLSQIGAQVGRPKTTIQNICARSHLPLGTVTVPVEEPAVVPMVVRPEPAPGEGCAVKGGCEWPLSSGRPWWFCTKPREAGGVYCREHRKAATAGRGWQGETA